MCPTWTVEILEVDQVATPNVTPSMLRGEAHLLLYVAVHSDKMERMTNDRNGTVQASEFSLVAARRKLEVKQLS